MKKVFIGMAFLLSASLSLFFAGCELFKALGFGADDGPDNRKSTVIITGPVDLTNVVPKPVTDGTVTSSSYSEGYNVKVVWTDEGGAPVKTGSFQADKVYKAKVTLIPREGYAFPASVAVLHNRSAPDGVSKFTGNPPLGTVVFARTTGNVTAAPVSDMDLAAKIPAPQIAVMPKGYLFAPRFQYAGPVEWYASADNRPHSGLFQPGTAYTAKATLIAVSGFVFNGSAPVFLYGGLSPQAVNNNDGTFTVTVSFPKTGSLGFSGDAALNGDSAIDKITAAKAAAQSSVTVELGPETETVNLGSSSDLGAGLSLDSYCSPASVVIDGRGRTVRLDAGSGSLVTVGAGVTLRLANITFAGKAGNSGALISVEDGGRLILDNGARITGNTNSAGDGGGVRLDNGHLVMNGSAEISGNSGVSGGGVALASGSLVMNGGTVSGNKASVSGGGVFVNGGVFTMNKGTVYGSGAG
ncbi:MAG: hypothetical protein LBL31_03335, partial [Spirochaetaceae bacterium]|nr:hypothetical protein [Spirochaetaceae bacterium]